MNGLRKEQFLGTDKYILGDSGTDLVLETLGKVYVKIGNQTKVLSDVLSLLDSTDTTSVEDSTTIINNSSDLDTIDYPGDGKFVFDTSSSTLYICYNNKYIAIIQNSSGTSSYVLKTGDTMSGQLEITTNKAPLIVYSKELVSNLNAEYLNGTSGEEYAKKNKDETITGKWTYSSNTTFNNSSTHYGDIITSKSITTPNFVSGFSGYGWRIDGDTNTLTIDYLIVRKAMKVYELCVNKITATNGSIWVSNSSKCSEVIQPIVITSDILTKAESSVDSSGNTITLTEKEALATILGTGGYFIVDTDNNKEIITKTSEISSADTLNTTSKSFVCFKYMTYIKNPSKLLASSYFKGISTMYDHELLNLSEYAKDSGGNYTGVYNDEVKELLDYMTVIPIYQDVKSLDETSGLHVYKDSFNRNTNFYTVYDEEGFKTPAEGKTTADYITSLQPYYKYYALDNSVYTASTSSVIPGLYVISTSDDEYPVLKPGDLIRCQKYSNGDMVYYDAIILVQIDTRKYIIQKALSVFDTYTDIIYNEDGSVKSYTEEYNNSQYDKTQTSYDADTGTQRYTSIDYTTGDSYTQSSTDVRNNSTKLAEVNIDDSLTQIGNIEDINRQNSIYLTSSDDQSPYIDIISDMNRPDYSVLYRQPIFDTIEYINIINTEPYYGKKRKYYYQNTIPSINYITLYNMGKEYTCTPVSISITNNGSSTNGITTTNTITYGDSTSLSSFTINNGATSTATRDISISIVFNTVKSHSIQYMISETQDFTNGVWYDIKDNIHYTLAKMTSSTTESRTIYLKIRDLNEATTVKAYATTVPTINSVVSSSNGIYKCSYIKPIKVRLGKLDGILDPMLGTKQPYGYGLYGQNVFLSGEFYLNNGQTVVDFSQDGIKEYYKNAGLTVGDAVDSYGNKTGETCITMQADKFVWNITKSDGTVIQKAMSLMLDDDGNLILDINGIIEAEGLIIKNKDKTIDYIVLVGENTNYDVNGFLNNNDNFFGRWSKTSTSFNAWQFVYMTNKDFDTNPGTMFARKCYFNDVIANNFALTNGSIGPFEISNSSIQNFGFETDANIIFRKDSRNLFAGIGTEMLPSSTGIFCPARFENKDTTTDENWALYITASGASETNIALSIGGGSISNLNYRTKIIDNSIASNSGTTLYTTLEKTAGCVVVSTANKVGYRSVYVKLPTVTNADDGHTVKIKNIDDGGKLYLVPGYNVNGSIQTETCLLCNRGVIYTSSNPLLIEATGDAMELVYFKNLVYIHNNVTYSGGTWVQFKNPRDW
jgi:hypothetical protein